MDDSEGDVFSVLIGKELDRIDLADAARQVRLTSTELAEHDRNALVVRIERDAEQAIVVLLCLGTEVGIVYLQASAATHVLSCEIVENLAPPRVCDSERGASAAIRARRTERVAWHHEHRARRTSEYARRDAAKHHPANKAVAVATDRDDVGLSPRGEVEQCRCGIAGEDDLLELDTVRCLEAADQPREVVPDESIVLWRKLVEDEARQKR